jgi:hypothetical protein
MDDLTALSARRLAQRAADMGIDEGEIEAADEADDRKKALIALIETKTQEAAAAAAAAAEEEAFAELKAELSAMSARKLGQRCAEMGIDEAEIEAADEADDRKEALIGLLLKEQAKRARAAKEEEQQLRADLAQLSALKLAQRCEEMGIDETAIEAADEADDRKAALIDLIVKAAAAKGSAGAQDPAAPAAAAEPEPEPAPVPEGAPAGNAAAMSDRVLNFEARTGADLTPITGWQDKPLVSLGKSLEGVPVKDVQIHAEVAVEFGESYKLTHPAEKRSVDQLGKPQQDRQQDRSLSSAWRAVLASCRAGLYGVRAAERHLRSTGRPYVRMRD